MKQINVTYRAYYTFDDMITINHFDLSLLKINKKSYKNISIYYIGISLKD